LYPQALFPSAPQIVRRAEARIALVIPWLVCYKTLALENKEDGSMEFIEKARIRLEHWIHHSEEHYEEYLSFAQELEDAGKIESARHLKEMISLTSRSNDCLKKAMKALV